MKNNRGIVFVTDSIMAVIAVSIIITAAFSYVSEADFKYWEPLYAQELGDDVCAVLDEQGVLATLDSDAIEGNISALLPPNYMMWAGIKSYSYGGDFLLNETIDVGSEPPTDISAVSGRRVFMSGEDYVERYNVVTYKVWTG